MSLNVPALRSSFDLVVEREPQLTHLFYDILFQRYPQAKPLFRNNPRQEQEKMLTDVLVKLMDHLEDAPWLVRELGALGSKHADYGVTDEMYGWVGSSLLAALEQVAADEWTPELAAAWTEAFQAIASLMQAGARQHADAE
ncbi:MAG TPA: globin domain-containing protein [Polyangiaceae bacterium]